MGIGDAERGKAVFNKRCSSCHAMDANREGPNLRGVFGRKAGKMPGFTYSAALKASGITWNQDSLEDWLSDTDAMIPKNGMGFRVVKAAERSDLIAYLKQTK
jgi:cytochrome c